MSLARKVAITGIGETEYTKGSGMTDKALQLQAVERAIADAGLKRNEIDGLIPTPIGPGFTVEGFAENLGLKDLRFSVTVHFGGANGITGLQAAAMAVASGVANHVVVVSGRNGYSGEAKISTRPALPTGNFADTREFEAPFGATVPMHFYALIARRHMHEFGTTSRHMGAVAVTFREHAMLNDKALMKKPMTIEDHQASRGIVEPFRLFDCCIESDGAAAYLVSSAERARDMPNKPAYVLGVAEGHPDSPMSVATRKQLLRTGVAVAAPRAYAMAGVGPADIRSAFLYDPFSFLVISQLESLGFCKPGEAGPFVESGGIRLGGRLPVNTHGGLLSQAHSMSAINHVAEAVKQLRGKAGRAQIAQPSPLVVTGNGDFGDGAVAILANE
jgi:acetyl-CoA acetyltransferase